MVKAVRPPESLLNEFHELSDLNEEKRLDAINRLLKHEEFPNYVEYTVTRLVAGLASSHAASRFGYATALALTLSQHHDEFTVENLFEIADSKMEASEREGSRNATGHHLLCTSLILSGAYKQEFAAIVRRELDLAEKFPFLSCAVADSIVNASQQLTEESFATEILPLMKPKLPKSWAGANADQYFLINGLRPQFSKVLAKETPLVKKGKLVIKESDFEHMTTLIKNIDTCLKRRLVASILSVGQENGSFGQFYKGIVEPYATHGDEAKAMDRYFTLLRELVSSPDLDEEQVLEVINVTAIKNMRKYAHRTDPKFRAHQQLIEALLTAMQERITSSTFEADKLVALLSLVDETEGGDFDTKVGAPARFTEFLLGHLDDKHKEAYINKTLQQNKAWSVKRIAPVFAGCSVTTKKAVLHKLAAHDPKSEAVFNVVCNVIESLLHVSYHRGRFSKVVLKDEDADVLVSVAASLNSTKPSKVTDDNRALLVFVAVLRILSTCAADEEDREQYASDAADADRCLSTLATDVLVDLLMSFMSRKNRVHKAVAYYVFSKATGFFNVENVVQIIEAMGRTSKEMAGEDEDDDDFRPITADEVAAMKSQDEESEEEDDEEDEDEEEESDEDEDLDAKTNPALVRDIKKALGDAAVPEDEDEDFEDIDDMDEEEMAELDKNLADAFRRHTRHDKREQQEGVRTFRNKCFDLLTIYFTIADTKTLAALPVPLVELSVKLAEQAAKEHFTKVDGLFELLSEHKKEQIPDKAIIKHLTQLIQLAPQIRSKETREFASRASAFLFSLACDHSSNTVSKKVVAFYDQLLRDYLQATEKSAVFDILAGPFRKYPFFLPEVLPKLVSMAQDENLPLGKKTELLNLADAFIRRDVLSKLDSHEQLAASLGGICENLWAKPHSEKLKTPYVASVLRLLQRITSLATPELVTSLAKHLPSVRSDYQAILEALKPFNKAIQRELHGKLDGTLKRLAGASA